MPGNLFEDLPAARPAGEYFEPLLQRTGLRIERIVSHGEVSPAGFWFDQSEAEWLVLVSGEALLRFEDEAHERRLCAGDWLHIEARRRHRVEWTTTEAPTIWLAVHYAAD